MTSLAIPNIQRTLAVLIVNDLALLNASTYISYYLPDASSAPFLFPVHITTLVVLPYREAQSSLDGELKAI